MNRNVCGCCLVLLLLIAVNLFGNERIANDMPMWHDTSGNLINAHGGGIMFYDGRYYWYGEYKGDSTYRYEKVKHWECWRTDAKGVNCYSSANLVDWKYEGCVLTVDEEATDLNPSQIIERPKVIYNDKTMKFVMWMHIDNPDYSKAHAGVAIADSPVGPFQYLGSFKPDGLDSRDQTIYKDDDGKAYQISSTDDNATLCIHLLDSSYTRTTGQYKKLFKNAFREAPAVFKREGKYYMLSSGCTGWEPNATAYAIADSMMGEWTLYGNPCIGAKADRSFDAQIAFVLESNKTKDGYLAMFDSWNKTNLKHSAYLWLPINFHNDTLPVIKWQSEIDCPDDDACNFSEGVSIDKVLSAFYVGFAALKKDNRMYIAYYDSSHQMVLASCNLKDGKMDYEYLPSKIKWDSHNYITMAFDKEGYLHLAGNMHVNPLVYFRSSIPYDIHSMQPIHQMIGENEQSVTYPSFIKTGNESLVFHYRDGGSGNGTEIYNIYDTQTKTWKRLLDKNLIDGEGQRNAYMYGPVLANDGYYHLIWVWRDSPDCSTNHTLSYARSKDLLHWENVAGIPVQLPITLDQKACYVDATPPKGGLYNPGIKLGFNAKNEPIIAYHKYDENGYNQLFLAKYMQEEWKQFKMTNWTYRWNFGGFGSMKDEIAISCPVIVADGIMAFPYEHVKEGKGEILFDPTTCEVLGQRPANNVYPAKLLQLNSSFPEMKVYTIEVGDYLLKWEALQPNRDLKPEGELPPASTLFLYKWK